MQLETVSNDFMKLDEIYQSKRESLNVLPEFRNILSTQVNIYQIKVMVT